jgi:hypothetical protein
MPCACCAASPHAALIRCELSLIAALIALVQQDRCLFTALSPHTKLNLKATLSNVS